MALFDDASLVTTPNGYKAGTLYSIKPTSGAGDMDVVRATTATRVNSAGLIESVAINVPRLDYTDSTCPSLLVEPQRTNLVLWSEDFSNGLWQKNNTTIITGQSSPSLNNPTSAIKMISSVSTALHNIRQNVNVTTSLNYTLSFYVKQSENQFVQILFGTGAFGILYANFDLLNGTITAESNCTATISSTSINGFYKCSVTATSISTQSASCYIINIPLGTSSRAFSYLGDGTSGVYIYGGQIEQSSYPTSYIPTTSASVTRNADVISKTGISSLIGQTEGTIFVDYVLNGQTNNANILNSEKNTTCSLFMAQKTNGNFDAGLYASAVTKARITAGSIAVNQRAKVAYAYKSGNSALYINGVQVGTSADTYTLPSTLDDIFLNDITTYFSYQENVSYNQATLFQTRLTNAELASLTTI